MVYVTQALTRKLLWPWLLLFSHLIMLEIFYLYSYLALIYISDMMQTIDDDYVTLISFSRSFEYIISDMMQINDDDYVTLISFSRSFEYIFQYWILATHLLRLTHPPPRPPPLDQLPAYIYCVNGQYNSIL